jgi:hypothetical protein
VFKHEDWQLHTVGFFWWWCSKSHSLSFGICALRQCPQAYTKGSGCLLPGQCS